jgi:hypothetical protein
MGRWAKSRASASRRGFRRRVGHSCAATTPWRKPGAPPSRLKIGHIFRRAGRYALDAKTWGAAILAEDSSHLEAQRLDHTCPLPRHENWLNLSRDGGAPSLSRCRSRARLYEMWPDGHPLGCNADAGSAKSRRHRRPAARHGEVTRKPTDVGFGASSGWANAALPFRFSARAGEEGGDAVALADEEERVVGVEDVVCLGG